MEKPMKVVLSPPFFFNQYHSGMLVFWFWALSSGFKVGQSCSIALNVTSNQVSKSFQGPDLTQDFTLCRLDRPWEFGVAWDTLHFCACAFTLLWSIQSPFQRPQINSSTNKILDETMTEHESIRPWSERGRPQTWAHWWDCNYRYALKSAIVSRWDNEAPVQSV